MITHKEAEILTSARQDEPLDPVVERELQAHLATCDECRAFAVATERLTAGIKAMPSIPVNPRTRREVMEQVQRGRNPFAGMMAGFSGGFQTGPVLAAVATLVIIGLFGWLALDRLVLDGGGDDSNQIAAVPTEQPVDLFVASPTQHSATETPVPTETPEPTATDEPEPTATEEPEPTATSEPEPTATDEPEPTATTLPTEEPEAESTDAADDEPTDLTHSTGRQIYVTMEPLQLPTVPPTAEPTSEPTAIPTEEPTAEPTPVPTEEPTAEPTAVPTEEPTAEPTNTPAIEPMDGTTVEDVDDTDSNGQPPIEPTGTDTPGDPQGGDDLEGGDNGASTSEIERIDGEGAESTPDDDVVGDEPEPQSLDAASVRFSGIYGDPSGKLGLTADGRLEFMEVPDGASRTTPGGFTLESAGSQPGVIQLCSDGYCEPAVEAPESDTWQGDIPLGVIGDTSYFLRLHSDRTEVYSAVSDGMQLVDPALVTEFGPTAAPGTVYENSGIMFAWLPTGEWLEISNGSAQLFPGGYSNPYNLRFAPLRAEGPAVGYFSNGMLIVAPVTAPDSPIFSVPSDGIDFDMTGTASQVAVIRGNDIVIYDINGDILQVYAGENVRPRSLIWLNGGIVYVDSATGALYQIPETAP